ncbi:hypothetical protein [Amycolatopsis sp. NBC_01480]|uniref:hypothetical protein n=1 Tax=Amycolatopsis sp. NBC_01480 TaxID=2903562 RepID=UPI002E2B001E|nr:hypothetical protein [Amycolatopsis sp. NBC_01480]
MNVVLPDAAAAIDAWQAALIGHRDGGEPTALLIADVETGIRELLLPDPGLPDSARFASAKRAFALAGPRRDSECAPGARV